MTDASRGGGEGALHGGETQFGSIPRRQKRAWKPMWMPNAHHSPRSGRLSPGVPPRPRSPARDALGESSMLLVGVLGIGDARRQTLGELQRPFARYLE